jgi:hypothetical protein
MNRLPGSWAEAFASGSSRYFTGSPCRRGHVAARRFPQGDCETCHKRWRQLKEDRLTYWGFVALVQADLFA